MSRDVYDEWNDDGTLPALKPCPFCGSAGVLNDNGYESPVIDMDTGAYIDMDIHEGDGFWCECPECGAILPGADTPEGAIEQWNRRDEFPNDPLTLNELQEMRGEPVFCEELHCWGVIKIDLAGHWANKPFLVGAWYDPRCGSSSVNFEYDIKGRGLTLYRRKPEGERK